MPGAAVPTRDLGRTGERLRHRSRWMAPRVPLALREGEHPHHPDGHRRRDHLSRQQLALLRRDQRKTDLRDGYRERAFLMTKIDGRSRKKAA